MAFDETNGSGMVMPVAPLNGYGNGGFGGGFGGDWAWIIILLLAFSGGWGGMGMGGFGGFGNMMLGYDFPWLMAGQQGINNNVSDGFRDAQLHDSVTSVRDSISALSTQLCGCCGDISTQLCNGFSGVTASVTGAQNALAQQLYANEIANLNRSFAEQTANTQGFTNVQSGLCDIRYGSATNTRDIIAAVTAGIQSVKDELCADRLDGYKRENDALRTQLNMATLAASQTRQTADIQNGIVNELRSCPIPSQPVFGNQPIFTCSSYVGNNGCGCGCGNGSF